MCQRSVQKRTFACYIHAVLRYIMCQCAHHLQMLGNNNQDDAHILGKGEKKLAEILSFKRGVSFVKFAYTANSLND